MKDYESMFSGKEGTVIGLCDQGLLIFDGFFYDGDLRAKCIEPMSDEEYEAHLDQEDYLHIWKECVQHCDCRDSFDDWWKDMLDECDYTCYECAYPFKDESFCEVLFDDDELREKVEDAVEEKCGWRPVTWTSWGWAGPDSFSQCYLVCDEELSKEFDFRREEIHREKAMRENKNEPSYGIAISQFGDVGLVKFENENKGDQK